MRQTVRPGYNGLLREAFIEDIAVGFEMADRPALWGGLSAKTLFSRDLSVTASLGPPTINRGGGRAFERLSTLGTWCPCVRVIESPPTHLCLEQTIFAK